MSKITLQIALDITKQQIIDGITTAFESGYSTWLGRIDSVNRPLTVSQVGSWWENPEVFDTGFGITYFVDNPDTGEDGEHSMRVFRSYRDIIEALQQFAESDPETFVSFLEDMDANTTDVFWQYVTYGECIYG